MCNSLTMSNELISTAQAAERAQVALSTITRAVANGHLTPAWRGEGRTGVMLFNADDIDAWIGTRASA